MFEINNKDTRKMLMALFWCLLLTLNIYFTPFSNVSIGNFEQEFWSKAEHEVQKVSVFGVILVLIYPHSDWIRRDTEYLSVFNPKAEKYGPE